MINLNHPIQTHKFMSAALHFKRGSSVRVAKNPLSKRIELGINSLIVVIIALITIISLAYLVNSNRNATKGYALKTLELERTRLLTENEIWDMEIAKVQALAHIQSDSRVQRMVKTDKPMFIRGDSAIAAK